MKKRIPRLNRKKKDKVKNLQSLYSTVKVYGEKVDINPMVLFLRLITVVERQPDKDINSFFEYELSPYPMSLFKEGFMRTATKHKLKDFLLAKVSPIDDIEVANTHTVLDGGPLLWLCNWIKGELFQDIAQKYIAKCKSLKADVVVFDGYENSTKSQTQAKRGNTTKGSVEVSNQVRSPVDRATFLGNYSNKERFIKFLSPKLSNAGIKTVQAPTDADTTIVKVAFDQSSYAENVNKVVVMADDTDILCILMHHYQEMESPKDLYIKKCDVQRFKRFEYKRSVPNQGHNGSNRLFC